MTSDIGAACHPYANVPHTGSSNYMGTPAVVTRAGDALALLGV